MPTSSCCRSSPRAFDHLHECRAQRCTVRLAQRPTNIMAGFAAAADSLVGRPEPREWHLDPGPHDAIVPRCQKCFPRARIAYMYILCASCQSAEIRRHRIPRGGNIRSGKRTKPVSCVDIGCLDAWPGQELLPARPLTATRSWPSATARWPPPAGSRGGESTGRTGGS